MMAIDAATAISFDAKRRASRARPRGRRKCARVISVDERPVAIAARQQSKPVANRRLKVLADDGEDFTVHRYDFQASRLLRGHHRISGNCAPPEFMLTLPPIRGEFAYDGRGSIKDPSWRPRGEPILVTPACTRSRNGRDS